MKSMTRSIILAAVLLILASYTYSLPQASCNTNTYTGSGNWLINVSTYCFDGEFNITGNITVSNSAKLNLSNVTLTMMPSYNYEYYLLIQSDSSGLFLYDSRVRSNSSLRYVFVINKTSEIYDSRISDVGDIGLKLNDDNNIIDGSIFENNFIALVINSDNNTVKNSDFYLNDYGIYLNSEPPSYLNNNLFENITIINTSSEAIWVQSNISGSEFNDISIDTCTVGFRIQKATDTEMKSLTINNYSNTALNIGSNSNITLYNTTLQKRNGNSFVLGNNNSIYLFNVSFNRSRTSIGLGSSLSINHYININVTYNNQAVNNTNISIYYNDSGINTYLTSKITLFNGITPTFSLLEGLILPDFDGININQSRNPYNLTFNRINYYNQTNLTMIDHSGTYNFYLQKMDFTPPSINIIAPINNSVFNHPEINFTFEVTDNNKPLINCSLYIDGIEALDENNITNYSILTTNYSLAEGNHTWYLNCTDSSNHNSSYERRITIDLTPPTIDSHTSNTTINETESIILQFTFTESITSISNYSITINSSIINLTTYDDSYNLTTDYFSEGNYSITYTAKDKANNTKQIGSMIEVRNLPVSPIITSYYPNQTTYLIEGNNITLGFNYTDPDNNSIRSNITSNSVLLAQDNLTFKISNVSQGTHNITFLVKDSDELIAIKNISLIVNDTVPTASFYFSQSTINESESISLFDNSTFLHDPIIEWFWQFGDGTNSTVKNPVKQYTMNGTYDINLTVTDKDGSVSTISKTATVQNTPMNFSIHSNITQGISPLKVSFNASLFSGNPPYLYYWNFTGISSSNIGVVNYTFTSPGVYNITLKITDDDGDTAWDWTIINVTEGPDMIPPNITYIYPSTHHYSNNENISFEFIVEDNKASNLTCSLIVNSSLNQTINATNGSISSFSVYSIPESSYTWRITCNDSSNSITTEISNLTVDRTDPNVTFTLTPLVIKEGETFSASCIAVDNMDNSVSTSIINLDPSTVGTRSAYCIATDDSGNQRTSLAISYTVEKKTTTSSGGGGVSYSVDEPEPEEDIKEEVIIQDPEPVEEIVFEEDQPVIEEEPSDEIIKENEVVLPGINQYGEQEKSKIKTRKLDTEKFSSIIRYNEPYKITRYTNISENSTALTYSIKNTGLVTFKRLGLFIYIHKNISNSTDNILGEYHIIEKDPTILFMSYNLSPKQNVNFSFIINNSLGENDIDLVTYKVSLEMSDEDIERLLRDANNTNEEVIVTKKVISFDNLTDVKIDVKPKSNVENLTVLLEIPKCLAETIAEIEFEIEDYEIIKDDPLVAFSYASLNEKTEIGFEVLKSVDKDCWEQIKTLPIAKVIKDKIIVNDNKKIFSILGIIFAINLFAIGFNLFQKRTEKEDKKSIFYKIEFGIVETILILIIVLNIIDFAKLLTPDFDFAKKILSLSILGLLLYEAKLEKIFYGREKRLETLLILLANFMLLINVFIDFVFIAYNEIVEEHHNALVLHLYQVIVDFELNHPGMITAYSMIMGIAIIFFISFLDIFKDIKKPSLMEALHIEGKPKGIFSMLERFVTSIIVYISFYIIFFRYFMEWLAISVDATLMVVAIVVYLVRFIIKNAHKYEKEHLINKIGNVGEDFYMKFVSLFQYRYTILFGLSGILVLHLLVDLGNYLVPFLFQFQDVLYFSQIGTTHPNMIYILNQLYTEDILLNISITLSYLLNIFFLISCMIFPGYVWYDIYRNHSTHISRYWIGGFFASIANYALLPLITITSIESNNVLGVDIIFKLAKTSNIGIIVLISIVVGIISYLISRNPSLRNGLRLIGTLSVLSFFSFYIYNYLKSWIITLFPQIVDLILTENLYSLFLGSLLSLFLGIVGLFYAASYIYFIRLIYFEWFVKKHVSHNLAKKTKEISSEFHDKGFTRLKIVSLIKEINSMKKKEISDLEIKEKLYERGIPPELIDKIIFL